MKFVIYPRAQSDIDGIWDYSAENWNAERADSYVDEIRKAVEIVAADPRRVVP
ncbi:MAG TPA: type II toxin-antitoxin system RelE/ParE family toxin [Rhizomicrobium sp.]|jgi:toxin ParE1/3/4